ncbi:sensor histidine kinase [Geosporobacter ferrireducens]|uniref:histidine kinase n=1 Tax=Geosporobacter ferrireducens TaxID=1424294 RepID=A0A1D8GID7_9FIRM|nr:HAMP domain-containing sensor histidine kinase [Geosporobacter ferrireducens]AOT70674.1 two-component sensor histidine kinase [Geosporobacter ferrireducens]
MKKNTIKWRIFKYNLIIIVLLITLTTFIFNAAVRLYIERDLMQQLSRIASSTVDTALRQGPYFFSSQIIIPHSYMQNHDELIKYYFRLDRSLREPLTILNADYILLDKNKNRIIPFPEDFFTASADQLDEITAAIRQSASFQQEEFISFYISGNKYMAVIKPVSQTNTLQLGWVIIYSSLQKVNQLQWGINLVLFAILSISALIIVIFSSILSKKISAPFSSLNQHIRDIAERNFGTKIHIPVDDELQELVNNINVMSEKLETYDQAQKTFLQNVSHEFRTPLMSIQSYAEGILYDVVDHHNAANIIIDETKRMTHLVSDLLYLSRLDTLEENYHFDSLNLNELISSCIERTSGIAMKNNIEIRLDQEDQGIEIYGDEEKLSRAITNILSNCIRYAREEISITTKAGQRNEAEIKISDDGPGFDANDLPNLFERFYKGKKGNFGLGLAISKNVIEKHNGKISAQNSDSGALFIIELPLLSEQIPK